MADFSLIYRLAWPDTNNGSVSRARGALVMEEIIRPRRSRLSELADSPQARNLSRDASRVNAQWMVWTRVCARVTVGTGSTDTKKRSALAATGTPLDPRRSPLALVL